MDDSLKVRLERINNLGNLRVEYLQRFYDGEPVTERYLRGDISIHIHGIATPAHSKTEECCLTFSACIDDDRPLPTRFTAKGLPCVDDGQGSVLVWVGEVPEKACPVATEARLQRLDVCLVSVGKPSQIAPIVGDVPVLLSIPAQSPSIFGIFDRKLCALLKVPRIQSGEFIDQIIKSRPKVVYSLPDENVEYLRDEHPSMVDGDGTTSLWVYVPAQWGERPPENGRFSFYPREVLLCPTYSRIGIVKRWLHMLPPCE